MSRIITNDKKKRIKKIENHIKNYNMYKVGIKNLTNQLDYIMPNVTANYDLVGGGTSFHITNSTEQVAIDRIESKRALDLHEDIKRYELIIDAIDLALSQLSDLERDFVVNRYIKGMSIAKTSMELGYSQQTIFNIRKEVFDKLLISLRGILEF